MQGERHCAHGERTLLLHDADEAQRFHLLVRTLEVEDL